MKNKKIQLAAVLILNFGLQNSNCFAQPGSLDSTFSFDGKAIYPGSDDYGYSVKIQSDGKIVVAGSCRNPILGYQDFGLVRCNSDGSLDSTFGIDGKVTTAIGSKDDIGRSVAIQNDGKIVVAGTSNIGLYTDFALIRYNGVGSLDTTFGMGAKVTTDFGGFDDEGVAVAIQSDGKIIVAGNSFIGYRVFALARYNPIGSLDSTFDSDGKVTTAIGSVLYANSVVIQSDGKIVVAGMSGGDFALVRYNIDGSLDSTFGFGGIVTTDFISTDDWGYSIAIQSDGKIIVAGESYQGIPTYGDFALARYQIDGSLDSTFDGDGKVTTDFGMNYDMGISVANQSNGKIVVAGKTPNVVFMSYDFALARYNNNGGLDSTFDLDGKVTTDFLGEPDGGYSVAIQTDGKVIVAGSSDTLSISRFSLARYIGDFSCISDCVWPGDANSDGIANAWDLLNIGIAYNDTGAVRTNATTNWIGQDATDWIDTFANGVNHKHADCDGNGTIDVGDVAPILLNYGLIHSKNNTDNSVQGNPVLYLEITEDTVSSGDTLVATVKYGDVSQPATNVYGLAFSVNYDNTLVDSASVSTDFSNSWLGTVGTDMLTLAKDLYAAGKVDIGMTRTDHQNKSGSGAIGRIQFILQDDIAGKRADIAKTLHLTLSDVKIISNDETDIPFSTADDSVVVYQKETGIKHPNLNDRILIYPNPFSTSSTIVILSEAKNLTISVTDVLGRNIDASPTLSMTAKGTEIKIDGKNLRAGIYFLTIQTPEEKIMKKVSVVK